MSRALAVPAERAVVPLSPEDLILKAIEANIDVEALERLMAMREKVQAENARRAFIDALAAFQSECPPVKKIKQADRYKYAPLEEIVKQVAPYLTAHGFAYRFDTRFEESPPSQTVACIAMHRDGHQEATEFRIPLDQENRQRLNVAQVSGSAMTYGRRYAFVAAFGILIEDEDDDAQSLGKARPAQQSAQPAQHVRDHVDGGGLNPGEVRMPPRSGGSDLRDALCPYCSKNGALTRSRKTPGEVFCAKGKGGCGKQFPEAELSGSDATPVPPAPDAEHPDVPLDLGIEPTDDDVDRLVELAALLPTPRHRGQTLELIEKVGFAAARERVVREHKKECGDDCPHLEVVRA